MKNKSVTNNIPKWLSELSLRISQWKDSIHRLSPSPHKTNQLRNIKRRLRQSIQRYRWKRIIVNGEKIQDISLSGIDVIISSWNLLKVWYRKATGKPLDSSTDNMHLITRKYQEVVTKQQDMTFPSINTEEISPRTINDEPPSI